MNLLGDKLIKYLYTNSNIIIIEINGIYIYVNFKIVEIDLKQNIINNSNLILIDSIIIILILIFIYGLKIKID